MAPMTKSVRTPEFKTLSKYLKEIREKADLSQRAVAKELKVSASWVAKVETRGRRIDMVEFCWFCKAVGSDPAQSARTVIRRMMSKRSV